MIASVMKFMDYARELTLPFRRGGKEKKLKTRLMPLGVQERFEYIFDSNYWGNDESRSGNGSTLASTAALRPQLEALFRELSVATFFDAPCGDWNWMRAVKFPPDMRYIGGDIVLKMTEELKRKFGSDTVSFMHMNIIETPFPTATLWMCRDSLFHLSNADIIATLRNFLKSEIPWALFTTMPETDTNTDILTGNFRPLNLLEKPFAFPAPRKILADSPVKEAPRQLSLWHREDIARALKA